MVLHLEEVTPEKRVQIQSGSNKQTALSSNPSTQNQSKNTDETEHEIKNAAKLSETRLLPCKDTNKFKWTVKEKDGYFQLGDPANDDDLYILNTTVISASYLHSLWDGKSPRKHLSDNCFWQIKYEAYGCEIASEPFLLGNDDDSRRTFIGDKATARIRTNGALFFEYLQETNLQFQIIRYQLGPNKELANPEVMGICFASLSELSSPDKREHRVCMDILSEWGTPRVLSMHEKPEVRVLFALEVIPNIFKICSSSVETNNNEICRSESNVLPNSNEHESPINRIDADDNRRREVINRNEDALDGMEGGGSDFEAVSNTSNARRLLQFENHTRQNGSPPSVSSAVTSPEKRISDINSGEQPRVITVSSGSSSESEESSNKENLARIMPPPGDYNVTIELNRFWLKSKRTINDNFILTYTHAPIGVLEKPVKCYSEPHEQDCVDSRQAFVISHGEFTKSVTITKFSESLLNDPLTVEFARNTEGPKSKCFASAMIPFGRVFSERV